MNAKTNPAMERLKTLAARVPDATPEVPAVRSQNERDNERVRTRQRGVFNGTNLKMDVMTVIPGHDMRWFNDTPGRISKAEAGGWDFVSDGEVEMSDSNKVTNKNSDLGGKIRAIVGVTDNNEPLYAYLMKIKSEWRQEDQDDMIGKINSTEQDMVKNQGMNAERLGSNKYLPDNRKVALDMKRGEFNRA